ncbi:MAG: uroporphyrinogen-III C-methyltransferase [Leptospirales bacterium]|nr:uroporphyrinogen-III C-methyltransferase [Leptospirales bacterium]
MTGNHSSDRTTAAQAALPADQATGNSATVYLVGAGPGDPDLLTRKAARIIEQADVILYDSLIGSEILDLARADCEKIFVGKRKGKHSFPQSEINQMLLASAGKHKLVVRLKGGDPFIFGRGGEEIEYLRAHNIKTEVIPGITAATAASALLQVPLTHRLYGKSLMLLSGYSKEESGDHGGFPEHDWSYLAHAELTLVFYMGQHHLGRICSSLTGAGKSETTPVALVSNCTLPGQTVLLTNLRDADSAASKAALQFPALLIIGNVLGLVNPADPWLRS